MIKTITKHGNSRALVIDKGVLDLLNITDETLLEIRTDGKSLTVTPVEDVERAKKFREALKKSNDKLGPTLKKLAG